jgi:hypothetical protein
MKMGASTERVGSGGEKAQKSQCFKELTVANKVRTNSATSKVGDPRVVK